MQIDSVMIDVLMRWAQNLAPVDRIEQGKVIRRPVRLEFSRNVQDHTIVQVVSDSQPIAETRIQ